MSYIKLSFHVRVYNIAVCGLIKVLMTVGGGFAKMCASLLRNVLNSFLIHSGKIAGAYEQFILIHISYTIVCEL
jgi:hypothetical protein